MFGYRIPGAAAATACAASALFAAGAAEGQDAARQTARFGFEARAPGAATSVRLEIDYTNPSDPAAKPYAVQRVLEALAPGARIDTSVPERCRASDAELVSRGAGACPAQSRVGGGEVDLDTGMPGPGRIVQNRVTMFNNENQLILLLEQPGGSRAVSRAPVADRTITADAPPIPGGPPDGFTAIKRVRLTLDRISAARGGVTRSYVTTPGSCPTSGSWTNELDFTYRDGRSQKVRSPSPCSPGSADARADRSRPRIRLAGVRRRCVSRVLAVAVRISDESRLRRVHVRRDRRLVRRSKSKRFRVRIPVGRLGSGRHRVSVAARDEAGNRGRTSALFRRC